MLAGDFADDASGVLRELNHAVAQILGFLLGVLDEFFQELHEDGRPDDHLGLPLDAIGIEIVFGAGTRQPPQSRSVVTTMGWVPG